MTSSHNENLSPTAVRFFKIILTTTLTHAKLMLPKKFTKKYGDGMSNPVFLKPPDGTKWEIYWTKQDDMIWFQKGWKEFATHYSIAHGYLLFFEYQGTCFFDVFIFGDSHIEVDYPFYGTHGGKENLVHDSDDSVEILDEKCFDGKDNLVEISDDSADSLNEQFSYKKTRVKSTKSFSQPRKKMKNVKTTNVERSFNEVNLHQHDQTRSASSQEAKFMEQKLNEDKGKGICHNECPKVEQFTSPALNKDTTFRSKHPFFTLVMKPPFINEDYLEIPLPFCEKYLKKIHTVVLLEVDGRSWPVTCSATRITWGWQKFASENCLTVGDLCVFELIQKIQGLAFKVSIFGGAEEPSSPISQGGNPSKISSGLESHSKLKILKDSALEEASKFTSENPFFMVTLTQNLQTSMARCPRVPRNFVNKYFVDMKKKVAQIQFREKLWPLTFVLNDYDGTGNLSGGWTSLARENKLQAGHVCIFELVNTEEVTLDLHVFRGHSN